MRSHLIVISIIIVYYIVSYSLKKQEMVEGFDTKLRPEIDLDKLKWGYLNTFYTGLLKEPLEVLKEPLPLQNILESPINSSNKTRKECQKLFDITNLTINNKKEVAQNRRKFKDLDKDPVKPFLKYCDEKKLIYKKDMINRIIKDCAIISLKLKQIYNRPRPYQLCHIYGYPIKYLRSEHADTPSYPSSFALQSYVLAYILGSKYSKHQKEFEKISNAISWSRVWSGNNFESDIECSKMIMFNLRNYLDTIDI